MSWSLQLSHDGDLVTRGTQLAQVTNQQKLVQDLRCAILERRGTDDMHRTFGSLIDGGYDERGNWYEGMIATDDDIEYIVAQVDSELRRIAADHQARQVVRSQNDRYTYGESTLNNAELLESVTDIHFVQAEDKLMVTVYLKTAVGQPFTINLPISIPRT